MKAKILVVLLALLGIGNLAAQSEDGYLPIAREGVQWQYRETYHDGFSDPNYSPECDTTYYNIEMKGDTIIEGLTYKKCYRYIGSFNPEQILPLAFVRDEGRKTYMRKNQNFKQTGNAYWGLLLWKWDGEDADVSEEILLYDFGGIPEGTVEVAGVPRNWYYWYYSRIVEGIGNDDGYCCDLICQVDQTPTDGTPWEIGLVKVVENGEIIYKGRLYSDVYSAVTDLTAEGRSDGDGRYYNLMGQPVPNPTRGIYIHNGKKVVIR